MGSSQKSLRKLKYYAWVIRSKNCGIGILNGLYEQLAP